MISTILPRTQAELLAIYEALVMPRLIEEKMLVLLRQGKISKWFSGIGQEAISVGSTLAMEPDEYIFTMHRNLGVFTTRKVPLDALYSQFQGKANGFTKGRDRSFHFGSQEFKIVGMISHLGAQLAVADGTALAHLLKKEKKLSLVFTGEGATSQGDFHEALNVASVWNLPVIFIIENNGYALSTPTQEQFNFDSFTVKGPAYGIEAVSINGNDILEVIDTLLPIAQDIRQNPRPIVIEANTFRIRGHEEASGTKYVPNAILDFWKKKDPIENFEQYLCSSKIGLSTQKLEKIKSDLKTHINQKIKLSEKSPQVVATISQELHDVWAPYISNTSLPENTKCTSIRFVDAINQALEQSLEKHPNLVLMGQDIAEYGGVFKATENLVEKYGKKRIRNTPLCESAIVGIALGLSIASMKSMVEMQFSDFVSCGFNQIVNNLAKIHYRWGQNADVVIRMPTGGGVAAGPFHSQSNEAWFFHVPGLKIVYPSSPSDAKGLLNEAFNDPNPILFFEHKKLYRSVTEDVPTEYFTTPIGKAKKLKEGTQLTLITYGMGVHWALKEWETWDANTLEIIDLRTVLPWDQEMVWESIKKTNKVLVLHEATLMGGIGGEIAAWIAENAFEMLDAPVMRVASLDTPVPFAPPLENNFLPLGRLKEKISHLLQY